MAQRLLCPSCASQLNPGNDLILAARHRGHRGLVLLHPEPGNYRVAASQTLELTTGEAVEFSCPVCQTSLHSRLDDKLVQLDFVSAEGEAKGFVAFSRVYGEHSTFVVASGTVNAFGEDAASYVRRGLFIGLHLG